MILGLTNLEVAGGAEITSTVTAPYAFKDARLKISAQFAVMSILVGLEYIFQSDELLDPKKPPSWLMGRLFEGDGAKLTFDATAGHYIQIRMINLSSGPQIFSGFLEIP